MSNVIIISNLNTDKNLDKAALAKILGGSASAIVGSGNTIAIGGYAPLYHNPCYKPCAPHYGPKAFQLSYDTSFEQAFYQKSQKSLDISYFQA